MPIEVTVTGGAYGTRPDDDEQWLPVFEALGRTRALTLYALPGASVMQQVRSWEAPVLREFFLEVRDLDPDESDLDTIDGLFKITEGSRDLQKLRLQGAANVLSEDVFRRISRSPSLRELNLSNASRFTPVPLDPIFEMLRSLPNLERLFLDFRPEADGDETSMESMEVVKLPHLCLLSISFYRGISMILRHLDFPSTAEIGILDFPRPRDHGIEDEEVLDELRQVIPKLTGGHPVTRLAIKPDPILPALSATFITAPGEGKPEADRFVLYTHDYSLGALIVADLFAHLPLSAVRQLSVASLCGSDPDQELPPIVVLDLLRLCPNLRLLDIASTWTTWVSTLLDPPVPWGEQPAFSTPLDLRISHIAVETWAYQQDSGEADDSLCMGEIVEMLQHRHERGNSIGHITFHHLPPIPFHDLFTMRRAVVGGVHQGDIPDCKGMKYKPYSFTSLPPPAPDRDREITLRRTA
ncbi:hypothetical protein PsYK624_128810 [Phanerochaete sordida]|uniref:F-box domain-containing protein n=1 Tax=Phanerochaete sordida TaxID=48140 RepID=A0A9P3GNM2_9APHY|nr:hypothetical protein PsYK624_128810 [Phanerochaete sordida]